ncbi:hypothetical protein FO519_006899 [Halicephalobus sp. NKZ332]|nr:hypothetical protein FO519_006899 [Halicephalobus sp. NKZ332]
MGKTKKAWKKLRSVDEVIPKVQKQKEFDEIKDSDLFTLDDAGVQVSEEKLSKRQQRLKEHQKRLAKLEDVKDIKKPLKAISQREKIYLKPGRLRAKEPTPPPKPAKIRKLPKKDIWDEPEPDPVAEADDYLKNGLSYDLKVRKIIRAKKPRKTVAYIPSAKRAIQVAKPGASYNPNLDDYINYTNEIAEEEAERLSEEKKLKKAMSLPKGMNYVTAEDKQAEMEEGFFEESSSDEEEDEDNEEPIPKKPSNKPKFWKKKKRALANKMAELEKQAKKEMSKKERIQFSNIKKIIKEMDEKDSEIKNKAKANAVEKMMDKLLKRKKLGRGEFEKYEEPVLLTSELKGSLRLAKTEGSLLQERFKSLQERNMLPIAGPDDTRRLPRRLKERYVDKRDRGSVTATSRVI